VMLWYGGGCYGVACDVMVWRRMLWCSLRRYGMAEDVMV